MEIGGDVESSYGSMSSYMHVADPAKASFNRGTTFWLIKEAQKRNPDIPLYVCSILVGTAWGHRRACSAQTHMCFVHYNTLLSFHPPLTPFEV